MRFQICVTALTCTLIMGNALVRQGKVIDVVELPPPSGPLPVGTALFSWEDKSREEAWTADPGDHRRLIVQLWYPAEKDSSRPSRTVPYIPEFQRIKASMDKYWADLPIVKTHAVLDARLSSSQKRYPVIVFSHGMNSARYFYTALLENLASHGYIIAAIDHTYWGPAAAFSGGPTIGIAEGMGGRDNLSSDEIDQIMQQGIRVMVADQLFVSGKLAELDAGSARQGGESFANRFDLSKVGVMGHSMGGMAATRACLEYKVFKACVSLDGPDFFLYRCPTPTRKPFLLLLNSDWGLKAPPLIAKNYLLAWVNPKVFIIHGAKHPSFSDTPLIRQAKTKQVKNDPVAIHGKVQSMVLPFCNTHLKGVVENLPNASSIELIDLGKVDKSRKRE